MKKSHILLLAVLLLLFFAGCAAEVAAPNELHVTLVESEAHLEWDDVNHADYYRIYKKTDKDSNYSFYADTKTTQIDVPLVEEGRSYFFGVEAISDSGVSPMCESKECKFDRIYQPSIEKLIRLPDHSVYLEIEQLKDCTSEVLRSETADGEFISLGYAENGTFYDRYLSKSDSSCYKVKYTTRYGEVIESAIVSSAIGDAQIFGVPVMMYHEFVTSEDLANGIALDEYAIYYDEFESDLKYLSENEYTTITTSDLEDYILGRAELPEKPIILTIDDGKYGVYKNAYPLLQKYQMKAVLSLIGYEIDDATENPEARSTSDAPYCTWDEIREMANSGVVEMISHTQTMHVFDHDGRTGASTKEGDTYEISTDVVHNEYKLITEKLKVEKIPYTLSLAYPYSRRTELSDMVWYNNGFSILYAGSSADIMNYFVYGSGMTLGCAVVHREARMLGTSLETYLNN